MESDPLPHMPEVKATARAESWVDEAGRHWHRSAEGYWWWWAGDHWETLDTPMVGASNGGRPAPQAPDYHLDRRGLEHPRSPGGSVILRSPHEARCGNDCGSEAIIGWVLLGVFLIGDLIMWLAWPRRQRLTP